MENTKDIKHIALPNGPVHKKHSASADICACLKSYRSLTNGVASTHSCKERRYIRVGSLAQPELALTIRLVVKHTI